VEEILVCGSVAIDLIGTYSGKFSAYEEKYGLSNLNVSLQLSSFNFSFGGCGLNIAWGLNQLGFGVIPVSVAGRDFEAAYRAHLENAGISTRYIILDEDFEHCALAVILTDEAGNQFTAFHAGAAVSEKRVLPGGIPNIEQIKLAILAPEDAPIMLRQARDLATLAIPFIFDPGQGLAEFNRHETEELVDLAEHIIVNQHEWHILKEQTGYTKADFLDRVSSVIITRAEKGSSILSREEGSVDVKAVPCLNPVDPTGCGDAYRAGFIAGLLRGKDIKTCGSLGALLASYNLGSQQTQQYSLTLDELYLRYQQEFGRQISHAPADTS